MFCICTKSDCCTYETTVTVTRLIRISFGAYDLGNIPAGMAVEVPLKSLERQIAKPEAKLNITRPSETKPKTEKSQTPPPVEWIKTL